MSMIFRNHVVLALHCCCGKHYDQKQLGEEEIVYLAYTCRSQSIVWEIKAVQVKTFTTGTMEDTVAGSSSGLLMLMLS